MPWALDPAKAVWRERHGSRGATRYRAFRAGAARLAVLLTLTQPSRSRGAGNALPFLPHWWLFSKATVIFPLEPVVAGAGIRSRQDLRALELARRVPAVAQETLEFIAFGLAD